MTMTKLSKAQEDIVRTLARAGMIDFDGRRARALQVLQRAGIIRQHTAGYTLTDEGDRVAATLPLGLRTQKETDAWLTKHVKIGACIKAVFAPTEPIDLTEWIGARECCSSCGAATPGLRTGKDGAPDETCARCGETGMLITCWGTAQTERWECGERYTSKIDDDGPQVGPIVVVGGVSEHAEALLAQAVAAWVKSEDRRPRGN